MFVMVLYSDIKSVFGITGIPDDSGLRPLCWKIMLNYLPPQQNKWKEVLRSKRELYKQFISE